MLRATSCKVDFLTNGVSFSVSLSLGVATFAVFARLIVSDFFAGIVADFSKAMVFVLLRLTDPTVNSAVGVGTDFRVVSAGIEFRAVGTGAVFTSIIFAGIPFAIFLLDAAGRRSLICAFDRVAFAAG